MMQIKRFTASWCAPCRALAPMIKGLEPVFPHIHFETIDIDQFPEEAQKYNIRSVPTVIIIKDNNIETVIVGVQQKQKYIDAINAIENI